MTAPTTTRIKLNGGFEITGSGFTVDKARKIISLQNEIPNDTHWWIVAWNGHEFEVMPTEYYISDSWISGNIFLDSQFAKEGGSILHYPIDPRMYVKDIAAATIAYPNETNDGWMFAHCDNDFHLDHEDRLQGAVSAAFESEIERANKVFRDAVYDCFLVNDRGNQAAVFAWNRMVHNLNKFRDEVKAAVIAEAQTRHLGYFHQNPHDAHIHEPMQRAIQTVVPKWDVENRRILEWNPIKSYVDAVFENVSKKHTYERRWEQAARLEAERKAAETIVDPEPGDGE